MPLPVPRGVVVALLALSSPASLAAETILRNVLFPPEMDALREALGPILTPVAWGLLAVTCVAAAVALPAHRAIHRRMVDRAVIARPGDALAREEAAQGALYLGASVVQLPTLLSTMTFMFGAALAPVASALAAAALGVALLGAFGPRD